VTRKPLTFDIAITGAEALAKRAAPIAKALEDAAKEIARLSAENASLRAQLEGADRGSPGIAFYMRTQPRGGPEIPAVNRVPGIRCTVVVEDDVPVDPARLEHALEQVLVRAMSAEGHVDQAGHGFGETRWDTRIEPWPLPPRANKA
jgi:hypothetical protein